MTGLVATAVYTMHNCRDQNLTFDNEVRQRSDSAINIVAWVT